MHTTTTEDAAIEPGEPPLPDPADVAHLEGPDSMTAALALVPPDLPVDVELVDVDDSAYRVDLDPEAQCLCALLWAPADVAERVVSVLRADDFYRTAYGELYAVIARLVRAGQPHTASLVLAELQRAGTMTGYLSRTLLEVTLADARAHDATPYARAVLGQAYRRGYAAAATRLAQIAETAHEEDLYELMCQIGRDRRDAKHRLDTITW